MTVLLRVFCVVVMTVVPLAQANAEQVFSASGLDTLKRSVSDACLLKQASTATALVLREEAVREICGCVGEASVARLLSSTEFQMAFAMKDKRGMERHMLQVMSEGEIMPRVRRCLAETELKLGGLPKMVKRLTPPTGLDKIGLTGEERRSFIAGGREECELTVARQTQTWGSQTRTYCQCALGAMADKMSIRDMVDWWKGDAEALKKIETLGAKAATECKRP